jgi:hypothetical protein
VNGNDLRLDERKAGRHRLGAGGAAWDGGHAVSDLPLTARRSHNDDGPDTLGALECVERPLEERTPPELYEGLRAAGPQPFAGAGGRDDR